MTWTDLVRTEPRLADLAADIVRETETADYCANEAWYGGLGGRGGFKARLCLLVGSTGRRPELRSCDAYDVAYEYLYALLPPCSERCGCL